MFVEYVEFDYNVVCFEFCVFWNDNCIGYVGFGFKLGWGGGYSGCFCEN